MLSKKSTKAEIEGTIHRVVADVLRSREREVPEIRNEDELVSLGLASLDLATIVAVLERELKADPFLEFRSITEVRTVGDLCAAYRDFIVGGDQSAAEDPLHDAQARGRRRAR
jgi:acyl carrier protein